MKKILPILIVLILLVGGGVGAAVFGIIQIPGLTPKKAKPKVTVSKADAKAQADALAAKAAADKKDADDAAQKKAEDDKKKLAADLVKKKAADAAKVNPVVGAESLAALWNEMDAAKLKEVVADWKDADVATVFLQMDPGKVAEVLALLDAKRASKISAMVEKQASVVKA